ncbi:MAG: ABC transporter ATP-binding protein [candidate division KSB1 bacterium]|nr:ABC transporter ATP-binding protein [candidate division KSB1 bacterium]
MNVPVRHIHLQNIHKRFSAIRALRGVNLSLRTGEVHALLGQNGAGKSTLMKILYGLYQPDAGRILFDEQPVVIESPAQAIRLGLGFVQQHFSLVESLTVAENFALGALSERIYQPAALQTRIQEFIDARGMAIDAGARVADLSVGEKQRVEILKALYRQARFLILDEPTSVLSPAEIRNLFAELEALRRNDIGIVFISHKLAEVLEISDRITVLREGRAVGTTDADSSDAAALTAMMMGEAQPPRKADKGPWPRSQAAKTLLTVEHLQVRRDTGGLALQAISFELKAGEILGVAGVDGSGQQELVEAVLGLRAPARGRIRWPGGSPPRMGLIPADRLRQGLVPEFSVAENLLLAHADDPGLKMGPFYAPRKIEQLARKTIAQFGIVCRDPHQPVQELSGGNQQKLLVARAVHGSPPVVVAVNPTWGLDVAAAAAVQQRLRDLCRRGSAVLLVSTDIDEIYALSRRFFVLYNGRLMGWADPSTSIETVGRWMVGMADGSEARAKD